MSEEYTTSELNWIRKFLIKNIKIFRENSLEDEELTLLRLLETI